MKNDITKKINDTYVGKFSKHMSTVWLERTQEREHGHRKQSQREHTKKQIKKVGREIVKKSSHPFEEENSLGVETQKPGRLFELAQATNIIKNNHPLENMATPARRCANCFSDQIETTFQCEACQVALCVLCFKSYHHLNARNQQPLGCYHPQIQRLCWLCAFGNMRCTLLAFLAFLTIRCFTCTNMKTDCFI